MNEEVEKLSAEQLRLNKMRAVVGRLMENADYLEFLDELQLMQEEVSRKVLRSKDWESVLRLQGEYNSYKKIIAYGGQAKLAR